MRIMINASTSIGDSLYFSFMLENIHRFYPNASLQVMCWSPMVDFYKSFPFVEQVIPFDLVKKDDMFAFFLLKPKIDLYIDLQHTIDSAVLAHGTGAKERIGVNPLPGTHDKYTYVITPKKNEQLKVCFLRGFSEYWKDKEIDPDLHLRIEHKYEQEALSLLLSNNILPDMKFAIIHPGAKGQDKLWDNKKWAKIASYLITKGYKVILIGSHLRGWGGADIFDTHNCMEINTLTNNACVNLAGQTQNFMILAALTQKASIYFGLDTGPTHLASLLGLPVVELYKFIDTHTLSLWKPYGNKVHVIQNENMQQMEVREIIQVLDDEPELIPVLVRK